MNLIASSNSGTHFKKPLKFVQFGAADSQLLGKKCDKKVWFLLTKRVNSFFITTACEYVLAEFRLRNRTF